MTIFVVFGEDYYDARAFAELIRAMAPACRVEPRRRPFSMSRNASLPKRKSRAQEIARLIAAEGRARTISCVCVHSDADAVSPADAKESRRMEAEYRAEGQEIHAVVPGWETESLWFLWPAAVAAVDGRWTRLPRQAGDVGLIDKPKERLKRALSQGRGRGATTYQESDSPRIAIQVREQGLVEHPVGTSAALDRLRASVRACSADLAPAAKIDVSGTRRFEDFKGAKT